MVVSEDSFHTLKLTKMLKGDKGVCTTGDMSTGTAVSRTKWNTKENCQIAFDAHLGLRVVPKDYIVYKCKACGLWHFGKEEWSTRNN